MATSRDGTARYDKWASAFVSGSQSVSPKMARWMENAANKARVAGIFEATFQMEEAVRQQLNLAGVSTMLYPFYLSFGRQMLKMANAGITGESAAVNAAIWIAAWVSRGLDTAVLEVIRTQVFNVSAPVGP